MRLSNLLPAIASVTLLTLAACNSGSGDPEPAVGAAAQGNGQTLASLNDRTKLPMPPSSKELLQITSVRVIAIDSFDETHDNKSVGDIYVQDFDGSPPVAYQGGLLFRPSYSPPSFRTGVGDVVDMSTEYEEFQVPTSYLVQCCPGWTTPELTNATLSLRYDGVGRALDVATVPYADLVVKDLPTYNDHARKWLSMLVKVENVVALNGYSESSGRGTIQLADAAYTCTTPNLANDPSCPRSGMTCEATATGVAYCSDGGGSMEITNELYDVGSDTTVTDPATGILSGTILKSVTGIVTMFDRLHVAPQKTSDIER